MATLQLIWNGRIYEMWSWSAEVSHLGAWTRRELRTNVFTAQLGPRGTQPTQVAIAKMARGAKEMHALNMEADFYAKELLHLQGEYVPRCYGFFRGKEDGVDVGCLLLEYCAGFIPVTEREIVDHNRAKMVAVCKLHEVGLKHGDLARGNHFVRMGDGVRIIDFSLAVRHRCINAYPAITNSRSRGEHVAQCDELALIERTCGFRTDRAAEEGYYRHPY
ncbi:hypothetical protein FPV67DRAFT_1467232 [Lyophyllum atratum]|nr:hypothetical protein FPV67DRAFT_1467232 [Lyophyllum atratum]